MNSAELQKLIDETPAGGTVAIPAGVHVIDAPLRMTRGVVIDGGNFNVNFNVTTDGDMFIKGDDSRPLVTGCYFKYEPKESK